MRSADSTPVAALLAVVLAAPALGGCLGALDDDGDGAETASNPSPDQAQDLESVQAALEADEPGANVDVLNAWRAGVSEEADVVGDRMVVDRGDFVAILDVSDPDDVEKVGEIQGVPGVVDVKLGAEGRYAFLGDDQQASADPVGGTGPFTGGVYVYDLQDPSDPERVTYEAVGPSRGPHMVTYHLTDGGDELVLAAAGRSVVIHRFDRGAGTLEEVGRYAPGQLAQDRHPNRAGPLYNPQAWLHDMIVQEEPDGTRLMYVAAWDAGLRVVDITDPAQPEEVGAWADFADDEAGNLHSVATEWVGDRRITVGSVEVGFGVVGGTLYAQGEEKSVTYVWDTTDPSDPTLLSRWTNPVDPTSGRDLVPGEGVTSTHNLQLEAGRIYQAHYDLGLWIVDISTPANQTDPVTVGYHDTGDMHTWDVVLQDGVTYTSGQVGVKMLHYAEDPMGPNGTTSDV